MAEAMTTPAVPVVSNIADLRELCPRLTFEGGHISGRAGPESVDPGDWHIQRSTYSSGYWSYWARDGVYTVVKARGNTEAEAARAMAERLTEAGYPPKEE